eukprot:4028202-Amphidinium_carterae.1
MALLRVLITNIAVHFPPFRTKSYLRTSGHSPAFLHGTKWCAQEEETLDDLLREVHPPESMAKPTWSAHCK